MESTTHRWRAAHDFRTGGRGVEAAGSASNDGDARRLLRLEPHAHDALERRVGFFALRTLDDAIDAETQRVAPFARELQPLDVAFVGHAEVEAAARSLANATSCRSMSDVQLPLIAATGAATAGAADTGGATAAGAPGAASTDAATAAAATG